MNDKYIIINTEADYPKQVYDEDHAVYLCVTKGGKVAVCKWIGTHFENAANYKDIIHNPVAYRKIFLPKEVWERCTGNEIGRKYIEYFTSLF